VAGIVTLTKAAALAILNQSVVSGTVNGAGHLILTKKDGSTIDGGDFTAIVTGIFQSTVDAAVATAVFNSVSGTLFDRGNTAGALDFKSMPAGRGPAPTNVTLVNSLWNIYMTGNITVDAATAFPAGVKAGTQFAVKFIQDATGGRTLTLTGFKKSQGVLALTSAPNAVDMVAFIYDGTSWYAAMMGDDFK